MGFIGSAANITTPYCQVCYSQNCYHLAQQTNQQRSLPPELTVTANWQHYIQAPELKPQAHFANEFIVSGIRAGSLACVAPESNKKLLLLRR